ncbi:helicase, partial [Candidatus Bathyarchaeota archaeon]|nr:helicase [Candidatus Bathyarchaeota archaeon]
VKEKGRKKILRVTEGKKILTYVKDGSAGLERLVTSIIAARNEIEREMASKGVLYKPKTRMEVEQSIRPLGFKNPRELLNSLKEVVKASHRILEYKIFEEEPLRIAKGLEMPTPIHTLDDIFGVLSKENVEDKPVNIVSYGESERSLTLLPVQVRDRRDGTILYKELIGVDVNHGRIYRGYDLLTLMSQSISNLLGATEHIDALTDMPLTLQVNILEEMRRNITELLNPLTYYVSRLEGFNLRETEKTWIRVRDLEVNLQKTVGYIHFIKMPKLLPETVPEDIKKQIEEEAIKMVIEVERSEHRVPTRVPMSESITILEASTHQAATLGS